MFDVFYYRKKPNLFAHEQAASNFEEAMGKCKTRYFWWINYLSDYSNWDFLWEPKPWESHQRHAWASQWQIDSGTYLIPVTGFTETNYHTETIPRKNSYSTYLIDHHNLERTTVINQLPNFEKTIRHTDSYKETLSRIAKSTTEEYIWVCSSVCDYTNFDFSWHPDPWQTEMVHVFPSNEQKFGDTFYIHVPSFLKIEQPLLEYYPLNFVDISVPRWFPNIHIHNQDTHVDIVKSTNFSSPIEIFTIKDIDSVPITVPLWTSSMRTITPTSAGASTVIVPRTAASYISTQLYDYPHIDKKHYCDIDRPLNIIFISNGESNADKNWDHLWNFIPAGHRVIRIKDINSRVDAYRAAAEASDSPWFFAVFAKLEVDPKFDWSWQPDRMQQPKHYIFHAKNPINGLVYGHMAMIAYNKKLVLENAALGLDFTLDQLHEVVPILSGTAYYADDKWMAWRSAFRECIKLKHSLPNIENEYRLNQWLTVNNGTDLGEWSCIGAKDALDYYAKVNGKFDELKKSYEWNWLNEYFNQLHT